MYWFKTIFKKKSFHFKLSTNKSSSSVTQVWLFQSLLLFGSGEVVSYQVSRS